MPLRVAIGTLPRLTDLAVIERRGDWVLVNIRTEGGRAGADGLGLQDAASGAVGELRGGTEVKLGSQK